MKAIQLSIHEIHDVVQYHRPCCLRADGLSCSSRVSADGVKKTRCGFQFKTLLVSKSRLHEELLDGQLDGLNLAVELPGLIGSDRTGDDGTSNAASPTERGSRWNEDVWDVLDQSRMCR